MAKIYRTTFFMRTGNVLAAALLRAGFNVGPNVLLTVRGRKTGQPRTTPVAVIEQGQRYLVAPFGPVNWVLNLRAAGQATLTRNRRSEAIRVVEPEAGGGGADPESRPGDRPRLPPVLLRCDPRLARRRF